MNEHETVKVSEAQTLGNPQKVRAKATLQCPLCGGSEISEYLTAPDRFHLRTQKYKLARCTHCTCVWLVGPPLPEEMSEHYSQDYHKAIVKGGETAAAERWAGQRDLISKYKQGGNILDIGCSSGGFLSTLPKDKWKLHGIEIAPETAEMARRATGAEVFTGEATQAPFEPNTFDVITSFDVLEHVYDPRAFLSKVQEWLKPGGIYFVMLPNIDSWESHMFGSYWYGLELPRHLFHFSPQSLRYVMNSLGFREVSLATPRICYVERSVNYLGGEIASKFGFHPTAQAKAPERSIPWRAARKLLRLSIVLPFSQVASWAGAGGSMKAVFAKLVESPSRREV